MKDEVKRILKLVQEGKLSAEDAAELIEAFENGPSPSTSAEESPEPPGSTPPPPPPNAGGTSSDGMKDPLRNLVEAIEKLGKDAANSVNWQEVAKQARESASKAGETIKQGFESVTKGGGFGGFFGNSESRDVSLPLAVPEGKTLRIENPCGNVKVTCGASLGQVNARAQFRGIGEEARAKADAYTVIIEESDTAVTIRQPDVPGLSVDLEVSIPNKCHVDIRSQSGNVVLEETRANCRVHTKSGDCQIRGANGQVEVNGLSGNITVEDSTATSCSIENKSGNIILRRVVGNANIRTASGDTTLNDCEMKSLALDGISGDIHVDLRSPVTHAVSLRTVSGNVSIAVPDGSDCRVGLKALRGHVSCGIPLVDEARAEGQVTGKLGEGKGTLDVSAVSGDIKVEMHVYS